MSSTLITGKLVIQQCLKASLTLSPEEVLKIGQGMVIFVCFLTGATEETVNKMVKHASTLRLSENNEGKRMSLGEVEGSALIVPQATLGGKVKGKSMQYHNNVDKVIGEALYHKFCSKLRTSLEESGCQVKSGIYGERQVLSMETNGPYTHIIDL